MSITEENILLLLQKIASQLFPNEFNEMEDTRKDLMDKIHLRSIDLHTHLEDFILAYESLEFIASDYQLRLKASDMWKLQKELFVNVLQSRTEDLERVVEDMNIDIKFELDKISA